MNIARRIDGRQPGQAGEWRYGPVEKPSLSPVVIARHALRSLHAELLLFPKPGLVSPIDSGSHADMNAATFMRSLFALRSYFCEIAQAGGASADFATLEALGIAAERRMLRATGGINTHRGAIFCLGLLCAAAGRIVARDTAMQPVSTGLLQKTMLAHWGPALSGHCRQRDPAAHGTRAAVVHGVGGARAQVAAGMPAVFDTALPILQATLRAGRDWRCARIDAFFALMAVIDDTNVYHRGGSAGAAIVQAHGQRFMAQGGTADPHWQATALASHRLFVARRLSPGGAADLLAAAVLVHRLTGGTSPDQAGAARHSVAAQ